MPLIISELKTQGSLFSAFYFLCTIFNFYFQSAHGFAKVASTEMCQIFHYMFLVLNIEVSKLGVF